MYIVCIFLKTVLDVVKGGMVEFLCEDHRYSNKETESIIKIELMLSNHNINVHENLPAV
jgi:hypothetical protein